MMTKHNNKLRPKLLVAYHFFYEFRLTTRLLMNFILVVMVHHKHYFNY